MKKRAWLIELRKDRSQFEVADAVGISQNFYSWIELGERTPSPKVAKKIGKLLDFDWTRFYEEQREVG